MRRFFHHFLLGMLLVGLIGPMTAYAWKMVLRTNVLKTSEEAPVEEESSSEELPALVLEDLELMTPRPAPLDRNRGPSWVPSRPAARVHPPEQAVAPRVTVVWLPTCLGHDEEPFQHA